MIYIVVVYYGIFLKNPDCMILMTASYFFQKLNGTLPMDPQVARVIRYSGLGVRSVGPVGDFLE